MRGGFSPRASASTCSFNSSIAFAPDPAPGAEAALIAEQRRTALDRAIAALPPKLKEPLILTAFEDLSHQAAGEALGVSAKTVETRVYRARKRLAELLGAPEAAS